MRLRGVTLLEMLVALALTGLVLVLVVQTIRLSGTAAAIAGRTAEDAKRVALRNELRAAFGQVLFASDEGYTLQGSAERIVFFARQSVDAYPDAYAIRTEVSREGTVLVVKRQIIDVNQRALALSRLDAPIGQAEVKFEYLAPCVFDEAWQSDWEQTGQIPVAFRISVEGDVFWPDFVAARPAIVTDGC